MKKFRSILSIILCFAVVFICATATPISAEEGFRLAEISSNTTRASVYSLAGTKGHEAAEENKGKSEFLCQLTNLTEIRILGEETDGDGDVWYKINYGENFENTGYVFKTLVSMKYEYTLDEAFEQSLQSFPESYHDSLRSLHANYPNWKFVANNTNIDFNEAVDLQYNPSAESFTANKKLVELTYGGNEWRDSRAYNTETNAYVEKYKNWTYASRNAIAYFVDPLNYLNERFVFAFLKQTYNPELQNIDGLRTIVAGTFLAQGYGEDADAYIKDIMQAAEESGVSPYILAAAIIVEVGNNGGIVTSGMGYNGEFVGYYNFYNWNATGEDVIKNALNFANQNGWDSPNKAIVGGAVMYAEKYVAAGQDTYYYKNYNYKTEPYSSHQYAESIYGSLVDSSRISKVFYSNPNGAATFEIPVFQNMSEQATQTPITEQELEKEPEVVPEPEQTPTPEPMPEPEPEPVIIKGDISGDTQINAIDLAAVKMDILGVKKLEGTAALAGDVNNDGVINAIDLAAIKMHILGVKSIG